MRTYIGSRVSKLGCLNGICSSMKMSSISTRRQRLRRKGSQKGNPRIHDCEYKKRRLGLCVWRVERLSSEYKLRDNVAMASKIHE